MKILLYLTALLLLIQPINLIHSAENSKVAAKLKKFQKQYPEADANGDGELTIEEATAFRNSMKQVQKGDPKSKKKGGGRDISFNKGWDNEGYPDHAVFNKSPSEIKAIYAKKIGSTKNAVVSYPKSSDGGFRIVGTGHSFLAMPYELLPTIAEAADFTQHIYTHTGGGPTGSARYKWEQENGIFDFDGNPTPKLLASISNSDWDRMILSPYHGDRPKFYTGWIDFGMKYHKDMKFYIMNGWPMAHIENPPKSEAYYTVDVLDDLTKKHADRMNGLLKGIRSESTQDVYHIPTSEAMMMAAKMQVQGKLPGVDGLHYLISKEKSCIWRDKTGHITPAFGRLAAYVFYATIYRKSPELIKGKIDFGGRYEKLPNPKLDSIFRKIAWDAVSAHPYSGVVDTNNDGIADK